MKRAIKSGATALGYGEIIGFSPDLSKLFISWINSKTHNSVLLDNRWNYIGVSLKKSSDVFISVINFSSGNLGSTKLVKDGDNYRFTGQFIDTPIFRGNINILDKIIEKNSFDISFNSESESFFIWVYNSFNKLTDRVDIFF